MAQRANRLNRRSSLPERRELWNWGLKEEEAAMKKWEELRAASVEPPRRGPKQKQWRKQSLVEPLDRLALESGSDRATSSMGLRPPAVLTSTAETAPQHAERQYWQRHSQWSLSGGLQTAPFIATPLHSTPLPDIGAQPRRPSPVNALPQLSETCETTGTVGRTCSPTMQPHTTLSPQGFSKKDWVDTRFRSPAKDVGTSPDGSQILAEVQASARSTQQSSAASSPVLHSPERGVRVSARFCVLEENGFEKEGVVQRNDAELGWLVCYKDGELGRMREEELAPLVAAYDEKLARQREPQKEPEVLAVIEDQYEAIGEPEPAQSPLHERANDETAPVLGAECEESVPKPPPQLSPASQERKYWSEIDAAREADEEVRRAQRRASLRGYQQQQIVMREQRRSSLPNYSGWENLIGDGEDAPIPRAKVILKLASGMGGSKARMVKSRTKLPEIPGRTNNNTAGLARLVNTRKPPV